MPQVLKLALSLRVRPAANRGQEVKIDDILDIRDSIDDVLVQSIVGRTVYGCRIGSSRVLEPTCVHLDQVGYSIVSQEGGLAELINRSYDRKTAQPDVDLESLAGEQEVMQYLAEHGRERKLRGDALKLVVDPVIKSGIAFRRLRDVGQMSDELLVAITDRDVALESWLWARTNAVHMRRAFFDRALAVLGETELTRVIDAHPDREAIREEVGDPSEW